MEDVFKTRLLENIDVVVKVNDKKYKFNSFVNNFRNALYKVLNSSASVTLKNLSNSDISANGRIIVKDPSFADSLNMGIVIGNTEGSNPNPGIGGVTLLGDYNLASPYTSSSVTPEDTVVTLNTQSREGIKLTISRLFYTLTEITVSELGLIASSVTTGHAASTSYLVCRDVIPPVTFSADSVIKVTIEFILRDNGGFLVNFFKILYSHFTNTAVSITTKSGSTVNTNFSGQYLTWKLYITESIAPIVQQQVTMTNVIGINMTYPNISVNSPNVNDSVSFITFKGSFNNTTTATYYIRELGLTFGLGSNEYLVELIKRGISGGIQPDPTPVENPASGYITLVPERLYRPTHSIGFKKD